MQRPLRALVLHAEPRESRTLSYQRGWPRALDESVAFSCTAIDLLDRRAVATLIGRSVLRARFDVVILLHSVFSNECHLSGRLFARIARMQARRVVFLGNEYKLMPEKVAFCQALGVDLLASQLSSEAALDRYRQALGCRVIGLPNTGLDPERFRPLTPLGERPVDIGYRSFEAPWYLGNRERTELAERVGLAAEARHLRTDISLDPDDRFDEAGWARFLDSCRAQLGSEAGGDYFELTDATRVAVNAYLAESPTAGYDEVHARFFEGYERPVSGRALSSRVIEAAGTGTVQLLLEGSYGGYFAPDVHYLPIRKDFSNLVAVFAALADDATCMRITQAARELALSELTFPKLVWRLEQAIRDLG
jgi:hypothetical protein